MAKKIDLSKLKSGLKGLSGHDYEAAENQERMTGNVTPDLTFSRGFYARLAGMALGIPAADVKDLPLPEYREVTQTVHNFLFTGLESEVSSENSASAQSN